jgi:urease accessory protein
MNVMGLVQLCQAAQPVGGYGYSFGIEGMAARGEIRSAEQLVPLVKTALSAAIGPADGVASGIAYRAARHGAIECLPELGAVMSSPRVPLEMQRASLQMGERLWTISRGWDWAASTHEQLDHIVTRNGLHHAIAFGALVSEATSSQVRAIATYLLNVARNIVFGAVRAVPLDERDGERVLASVGPTIAELAARCADKEAADIHVGN